MENFEGCFIKKYQIVEIAGKNNDAGTKAVQDAATIAERMGFESVYIRMNTTKLSKTAKLERQLGYWKDGNDAYKKIENDAVVLVQNPFHYKQLTREKILKKLKHTKNVQFISLVHDVEELRKFRYSDYYRHEFDVMLDLADALIVHNDKMAAFFQEKGVPAEKLVKLGIFDYLQENTCENQAIFEKKITVAGNLDTKKCAYIGQLHEVKNVDIQLYGSNFDTQMTQYNNIHYGGSFPPDEIPKKLTSGFGLVWDGTSIDGCCGDAGQYLRYNNPHKLSLYLSSGLPVVIWSGAAEADFVKKNNVGIVVNSLRELSELFEDMQEERYADMVQNARRVSENLKSGKYLEVALKEAIEKME